MACCAHIRGIQEWTNALAMAEVGAFVNGCGNHGRDISQFQMLFVAEFFERGWLSVESCYCEQ